MDSISSFRVCDAGQKEVEIDAEFCLSTDTYGRPVDIYSTQLSAFLSLFLSLLFFFFSLEVELDFSPY